MLGEAHAALAEVQVYYEWDWAGAEESFHRALELNPSLANAHYHYGWHLAVLGRDEEAVVEMKRARELDPLVPAYTAWLGGWYWYQGRYDEAIDEAQKSLELSPDFPIAYHVLGLAYASKGMYEEAISAHQRSTESIPPWRSSLGVTYALAGRMEEAREILAEIEQGNEPASPLFLAEFYAVLGEKDEAFRSLNESCDVPEAFAPSARIDPLLDPLRDDPRFQDLLRRMNLEP